MLIVHISIRKSDLSEPLEFAYLIYPTILLNFLCVGLLVFYFEFQVTWMNKMHQIKSAWIIARRCGGREVHRITDQARALIRSSVK